VIVGGKPTPALYNYLYRALQVGVLLLATGTILGGVWANYSWGRFWDWDPKETWALIALLGYLIVLHGRIAGQWGGVRDGRWRRPGVPIGPHGLVWRQFCAWRGASQLRVWERGISCGIRVCARGNCVCPPCRCAPPRGAPGRGDRDLIARGGAVFLRRSLQDSAALYGGRPCLFSCPF